MIGDDFSAPDRERNNEKLRQARDAMVATFDLLNDEITGPEWLAKLATLANCDRVTCVWWLAGDVDSSLHESAGEPIKLSADWLARADKLIETANPAIAGLLEDLIEPAGWEDSAIDPLVRSDRLVALADWSPSRVLLVFEARKGPPEWTEEDKRRTRGIAPVINKSIAVKKQLSWQTDLIELSNKIDDVVPHGYISIMPDRRIISTNELAGQVLEDGSLMKAVDGRLVMNGDILQQELGEQLDKIMTMPADDLSAYVWYRNLNRNGGGEGVLATMRAFKLDLWKRESTSFDRIAVIFLDLPRSRAVPSPQQIREFFQVTKAQARVVYLLCKGQSIEEVATSSNTSVNTVRTHLRSIYGKLGVNSKAQLMQMVAAIMAPPVR